VAEEDERERMTDRRMIAVFADAWSGYVARMRERMIGCYAPKGLRLEAPGCSFGSSTLKVTSTRVKSIFSFVLFRVISWIPLVFLDIEPIHEITRTNTKLNTREVTLDANQGSFHSCLFV
jgi:hypothetical protein